MDLPNFWIAKKLFLIGFGLLDDFALPHRFINGLNFSRPIYHDDRPFERVFWKKIQFHHL